MTPYEALYGRKCITLLGWYQDDETTLVGPELLRHTTEKVRQSRQKSYAD